LREQNYYFFKKIYYIAITYVNFITYNTHHTMTSKEKIITYLAHKEISQRKFSLKTGLSEGILRAGKDLGVDKMVSIKRNYPDLNMNWLIFDEGSMLIDNVQENEIGYNISKTNLEAIMKKFIDKRVDEYLDERTLPSEDAVLSKS
jgi:hypothetical protein